MKKQHSVYMVLIVVGLNLNADPADAERLNGITAQINRLRPELKKLRQQIAGLEEQEAALNDALNALNKERVRLEARLAQDGTSVINRLVMPQMG